MLKNKCSPFQGCFYPTVLMKEKLLPYLTATVLTFLLTLFYGIFFILFLGNGTILIVLSAIYFTIGKSFLNLLYFLKLKKRLEFILPSVLCISFIYSYYLNESDFKMLFAYAIIGLATDIYSTLNKQ